jgi:hypothetical protein
LPTIVKIKLSHFLQAALVLALSACGYPTPPCQPLGPDTVSVVSADWHSDIAIPVGELGVGLQPIAAQFPGAKTLLFGYGKETFMTAPEGSFSKYFTGLIPGQAAIEVTAVDTDLADIYPADEVVTLKLPQDGAEKLSAYISDDITKNADGTPLLVTKGDSPRVFVYAANSEYTFLHTCNGWAATGLATAGVATAGVALSDSRVVTSERLMIRAQEVEERCEAAMSPQP